MSALDDAIAYMQTSRTAVDHGVELVSRAIDASNRYASHLGSGGFKKAAETLIVTGTNLRSDVLSDLTTTRGLTKTSLSALMAANTDDLDVAEEALTDCQAHLAEIRTTVQTSETELKTAISDMAQLGSRTQTINTMLEQAINDLITVLSNTRAATRATQEAASTIGKMQGGRNSPNKASNDRPNKSGPRKLPSGIPENKAEAHRLRSIRDDVERQPNGLISHVKGMPVDKHLADVTLQRSTEIREMRNRGEVTGKSVGRAISIGVDLRTGLTVEGFNGRKGEPVPNEKVHPVLRERMEVMRKGGPYPQYNADGTPETNSDQQQTTTEFPHGDDPLRHAEVKVVNSLLWHRGANIGTSVMTEFRVDTKFPFALEGVKDAPCCANCHSMILGAASNTGRHTHGAGHPSNQLLSE